MRILSTWQATRIVFWKELIDVLRDRRSVITALVLPLVSYPLLFGILSQVNRGDDEARELILGYSGELGPLQAELQLAQLHLEERSYDPEELRSSAVAAFLEVQEDKLVLYHASASADSSEARSRVARAIEERRADSLQERFRALGSSFQPRRALVLEATDIATPQERSCSRLARLLPLFCVLVLLTGGAFAALDMVAGERERGTLETLYLHPVPVMSIARGKVLVVLVVTLASLLANLLGFIFHLLLEPVLGGRLGLGSERFVSPDIPTLVLIGVFLLPLALLFSAALLYLSAFARSYREGQTYLLPLSLVAIALAGVGLARPVRLDLLTACVPVLNVSLSLRQTLEGTLPAGTAVFAWCVGLGFAALALGKTVRALEVETVVLGPAPSDAAGVALERESPWRPLGFGAGMLLVIYFGASWLQSRDLVLGLAGTLWGLVLVPALLYPIFARLPWRKALGLRATTTSSLLAAPLLGLALVPALNAYMQWQARFLQMPHELERAFEGLVDAQGLSLGGLLLLFALSPGICEELLWRGAFQGDLRRRRGPWVTCAIVAIFFGLFHLSIFRLVPTAIVGLVLAWVRERSDSIFPCMVIHATYNAGILLLARAPRESEWTVLLGDPVMALLAGALLPVILLGLVRPRSAPGSPRSSRGIPAPPP